MVDETTPDDDEDWMQYANSGFGSTDYSLWDEVEEQKVEDGQSDEPD